jgi:Hg(II)-responsive transcriptional regulator
MPDMKIGELAERAGVSVQTIRYYEGRGLIPEPSRTRSGYRRYGESDVPRLRFIRRAQELGFTLAEIGELLALRVDPTTTPDDVRQRAREKIEDTEVKIRELQRIKSALEHLVHGCEAEETTADCPFLDALGAHAVF